MRRTASLAAFLSLSAAPALAAPDVVADMPATGALVQQVMGDLGEVRVLLPGGASVHHYQMRPSDAQALQSAELLVWIGPELTPWLARASDNLGGGARQLGLLRVDGTYLRDYGSEGAHDHGHDHRHGHSHDHDHDHDHDHSDDHDHEGIDPHAWLDPANAGPWLGAIAEALSAEDPDNAAIYATNAEAAATRIAALEAELRAQLAPVADLPFVVFHDAYGYFTHRFGLQPAIAVSLGDASTPSAARMDQVRRQVTEAGAVCAFPEYAHDAALVETAIEGSEVRLGGTLDPQGGGEEGGAGQYEAMLRGMADILSDCLVAE